MKKKVIFFALFIGITGLGYLIQADSAQDMQQFLGELNPNMRNIVAIYPYRYKELYVVLSYDKNKDTITIIVPQGEAIHSITLPRADASAGNIQKKIDDLQAILSEMRIKETIKDLGY